MQPAMQWRLPRRLREISGLAVTPDGRVMAHDDELAVIYEIDVATGDTVKRFGLGAPILRGDFEGLAITDAGDFYLTTSTGLVYRFAEGDDRASVPFEMFDVGLSHVAEIEGLAYHSGQQTLVFACKTNYVADMRHALALQAWSPRAPANPAAPWLTVPAASIAGAVGAQSFHPSGIEIDPQSGRLVVLASRENALAEIDASGALLAARRLGHAHPQPEGVTILADGALLITDEGGHGHACMTRYARTHV